VDPTLTGAVLVGTLAVVLDAGMGGSGGASGSASGAQPQFSGWSAPVNLGPVINTAGQDVRPALSFDGTALYFHSGGRGGQGDFDLFVTTRALVAGRDQARQ
jgi:hypothetical protein